MKKSVLFALIMATAVSCNNFTSDEISLISDGEGMMRVLQSNDEADETFLRQRALELSDRMIKADEYDLLCSRMLMTVQDPENEGVGIAGPQVGISRRIIAVQRFDKEGEPFEFYANPKIVRYGSETAPGGEGCLSVPDMRGTVERAQEIDIQYRTAEGADVIETVSGFTAVIFQHEIDHLDGVLYTDRASVYGNDIMETRVMEDGSKITWIQDNAAPRLMPAAIFQGADKALIESLGLQDGVPASVSVFLLEKDGLRILFDAANGAENSLMPEAFKAMGIGYEGIDYVYITHTHGDHIGGMFAGEAAAFPRAEVYISQAEYDGSESQAAKLTAAYGDRLHIFDAGDELPGGIEAIEAHGHTPGHTVYRSGELLIVGDILHGAALQMENPEICASFDSDKDSAISSRRMILKYAADNKLIMCGMHFPPPAFK